jgi:uncharacterized protein (TIGR02302 family)
LSASFNEPGPAAARDAADDAARRALDPNRPLPGSPPPRPPADPLARRLGRLKAQASAALWWERLWPPLAALLSLAALFVAAAWFGAFLYAPTWGRAAMLALFALAAAAILVLAARRLRVPAARETLARLDRDSGAPHRPVTALTDELADADADPATRALWQTHRARARAAAGRIAVRAPSPRLVERDRYALRAAALLLLVASAFVAGPQKAARLYAAFDLRDRAALAAASRIDAFLDPPAYTGRPPIVLPTRVADETAGALFGAARTIEAPARSRIVIRAAGAEAEIVVKGGLAKLADEPQDKIAPRAPAPSGASETRFSLDGDGRLSLSQAGRSFVFDLKAIPDLPPTVALTAPPETDDKSLKLSYRAQDDYGLEQLDARFADPIVGGKSVTGRSLVEPPSAPLALPPGGSGEADGSVDLADHPWAGARVKMTLHARDGAGQESATPPIEVTLPARVFTQPMAKALVEQRRDLVLSPDAGKARVDKALSALKIAPDLFRTGSGVYLGLSTAQTRLRAAKDDDGLRVVADYLWEIALRIEEGDLSKAKRDLQAAQQALREAMERGASPEEMKKLMDDLRAAMDRFLKEFAQRQPDAQAGAPPPDAQVLTQRDLDQMMKQMEDAAKRGDMAEAQRLLDQLERMMNGLRQARPGDSQRREMNRQMGELDKMTREQQRLRDDTHKKDRQARRGQPRPPQDGDEDADSQPDDQQGEGEEQMSDEQLAQRQKELRERLERLQERMKRQGMDPEQGLGDAEQAMRDAEDQLGEGDEGDGEEGQQDGRQPGQKGQQGQGKQGQGKQGQGKGQSGQGQSGKGQSGKGDRRAAIGAQGRALEALRRGMEGMQRQMQAQQGEGEPGEGQVGQGEGDPNSDHEGGRREGARGSDRLDPLDRPRADRSRRPQDLRGLDDTARPAERARRVQEELRRRLGEPARPQDERDYYERLLRAK